MRPRGHLIGERKKERLKEGNKEDKAGKRKQIKSLVYQKPRAPAKVERRLSQLTTVPSNERKGYDQAAPAKGKWCQPRRCARAKSLALR